MPFSVFHNLNFSHALRFASPPRHAIRPFYRTEPKCQTKTMPPTQIPFTTTYLAHLLTPLLRFPYRPMYPTCLQIPIYHPTSSMFPYHNLRCHLPCSMPLSPSLSTILVLQLFIPLLLHHRVRHSTCNNPSSLAFLPPIPFRSHHSIRTL